MKRDLPLLHSIPALKKPLRCRLGIHKWIYQSPISRHCVCGCRQKANENDARELAVFEWEDEK